MRRFSCFVLGGSVLTALFLLPPSATASAARPVAVPLPGGVGGIGLDDLQYSGTLHRVLVPAGRTGNLALIDPKSRAIAVVPGFSREKAGGTGHGESVTSVSEGDGYLFATDRTSRRLDVVDPSSRRIVASAPLASGPDYVRFVAPAREIWVTEPGAERIEVFSLAKGRPPLPAHAAFIAVPGGPESLVVDATRGRAYANLWKGKTVAIGIPERRVLDTWENGCQTSLGLALDPERGFLFVGCGEGKAVALDVARRGRRLGAASSGDGVDIIAFSPKLQHLYLPGARSATMAVIGVSENGALSLLGTVPTAAGAHCVAADDAGGAWVCDPRAGGVLEFRDPFPPAK